MSRIVALPTSCLEGEVTASGSKNATLPILAGTLLTPGEFKLWNVSRIGDVYSMIEILEFLGASIEWRRDALIVNTTHCRGVLVPNEFSSHLRGSVYFLGALLAAHQEAGVGVIGGDEIGRRSIDLHLKAFRKLGVVLDSGSRKYISATLKSRRYGQVWLDLPSLGATCNLMLFASKGEGETIILNAAQNPEVENLAHFLTGMGAVIRGAGTSEVSIRGVPELRPTKHKVMPDYLEAGTFCIACALVGGRVQISNCCPSVLTGVFEKIMEAGARVETSANSAVVEKRSRELHPVRVVTSAYPGFQTDLQPLMITLMTQAEGISVVEERVFTERFTHISPLREMGADIQTVGNRAIIHGSKNLAGCSAVARDIRGGMALVLARLVASGQTVVANASVIQRAYENPCVKLSSLGARVSIHPGTDE